MGDFSFGSEPLLEQQLLSLERMLKDQHEFHKWQLASFMEANTSLREENTALPNVATAIPRPDDATATHHLGVSTAPRSPVRLESTDNFSPPPSYDWQEGDPP